MEYLGIEMDPNRNLLFDENGIRRLKESYMAENETDPQQRCITNIWK